MFMDYYLQAVLKRPRLVLFLLFLLALALGWQARHFRLDASSDSLVREGDADLAFYRQMNERYAAGDYLFVTYAPASELFTPGSLEALRGLRDELDALERVESVDSMLDMPLFEVAGVSLSELDADDLPTLETPGVNLAAARADITGSEAYRDVLVSADGRTAGLVVNLAPDQQADALLTRREALRAQAGEGALDARGAAELAEVSARYDTVSADLQDRLRQDIADIRAILDRYRDGATVVMGGVPMIADDLITFVRNDLLTFGTAILAFIVLALSFLFGKPRYVLIPLLCCAVAVTAMCGLLGLLGWRVTVISSNFVCLLLIIIISLSVHLIVRYRELEREMPSMAHPDRLARTLRDMARPCAYTSLTTMVGFGSLMVSDIPPIVDFGWMMVLGVALAFLLTFTLFPAVMVQLPASRSAPPRRTVDLTPVLARLTARRGGIVLATGAALLVFSVLGLQRLKVENSFINYFDENTEIHRGMVSIDREMGGTTPLDVVVDLRPPNPFVDDGGFGDEFFEGEFFEDEGVGEGAAFDEDAYWFTSDKMAEIIAVHDWLDALPETGKVLSLATLLGIAYDLNGGPLDSVELGVLYNRIPAEYKDSLLRPYVSVEHDQVRYSIRVRESDPNLVRGELLGKIRAGLSERFGFAPEQVHLTGMLVLYNNMLQSLFESQILTLALVLAVIMGMFLVLFRSLPLALIGIVPNILAAGTVLAVMGWLGIPLDMMTITIAAISVGIGVDNTIHYIHRFKASFAARGRDYRATMFYCHDSIARAMYYTGFTIVAGFSILVLSNFVPTVYFGLLTSLAMILALLGALTLLPRLLILFKPLGREGGCSGGGDLVSASPGR